MRIYKYCYGHNYIYVYDSYGILNSAVTKTFLEYQQLECITFSHL